MNTEINATLDARGLNCPLPILRTKKTLAQMATGENLELVSTDPGSLKDIDSFCNQTGNVLVENSNSDGEFKFVIRKA
ncbi:MAG TPA: response regulator SirA [Gammaproteobacteria bacterium]|nr:response regulator SirA [Gammaproteobacteria bacterium]